MTTRDVIALVVGAGIGLALTIGGLATIGTGGPPWWQLALGTAAGYAVVAPVGYALGRTLARRYRILNPRRAEYDHGDPSAAAEQVAWECHHRRLAHLMMFWFPPCDARVTVQPIALLELGAELARPAGSDRGLVIGADPGYPRYQDVALQTRYDRPGLTVHTSLPATLDATLTALRGWPDPT